MVGTKRAVASVQMVNGDVLFTLKKPEGVNLGLVATTGESPVASWCSGVCWTPCRSLPLEAFGCGCRSWQDCPPLHCQACLPNGCVTRLVCLWGWSCFSAPASNLHRWLASCLQHREKESIVHQSLPAIHSLSTASPMQCLLSLPVHSLSTASPVQCLLSLPAHSLSTASPMQYLLVAAGVIGYREAPTLNLQGRISMTQR